MKKESIVRYSTEELKNFEINGGDKTDWQSLSLMKDEEIKYDEDSPKITEEMFSKATIRHDNQPIIRRTFEAKSFSLKNFSLETTHRSGSWKNQSMI